MKKLFYLLLILMAGYFLYSKCSHKSTDTADGVLKQVRVAVKTANLRTGPGTNFDFVLDAEGVKQQVKQGTVLDVVAQKSGWYEIRLGGDTIRTAFIKQSLCADLNASSPKKSAPRKPTISNPSTPEATSPQEPPADASAPTPPPADEVVEEVTTGSGSGTSDDEVIF